MLFIQILQKQLINSIASKKRAVHKSLSLDQPVLVAETKYLVVLFAQPQMNLIAPFMIKE